MDGFDLFKASLNTDELEVEFIVRGLSTEQEGAEATFSEIFLKEVQNPGLKPKLSHLRDASEATGELNKIIQVLTEFDEALDHLEGNSSGSGKAKLLCKVMHWKDRANRLNNTYKSIPGISWYIKSLERVIRHITRDIKRTENENTNQIADITNRPSTSQSAKSVKKSSKSVENNGNSSPNSDEEKTIERRLSKRIEELTNEFRESLSTSLRLCPKSVIKSNPKPFFSQSRRHKETDYESNTVEYKSSRFPSKPRGKPSYPTGATKPKSLKNQSNYHNGSDSGSATDQSTSHRMKDERSRNTSSRGKLSRNTHRDSDSSSEDTREDSRLRNRVAKQFSYPHAYRRRSDPSKWKISFAGRDGKRHDENVQDFVMKLEEHAFQDGIPKQELVTLTRNFVTDKADKWYYTYIRKNKNTTWKQLKNALIERFSSAEGDREMRRYIRGRTQQPKENFNDFFTDIESYNYRLTDPLDSDEILEILLDNMNPALKNATINMNITSIEKLRRICDNFEKIWNTSGFDPRRLIESRSRRLQFVSQISLGDTERESSTYKKERRQQEVEEDDESVLPEINAMNWQYTVCWNCKDLGHTYVKCPIGPTHTFCKGCGLAGTDVGDCLRCQKKVRMGNALPNATSAGVSRSERTAKPKIPMPAKPSNANHE